MYKINSFWIEFSKSLTTIERQTYSLLDWFGDVRSLFDGLKLIGYFLVAPFASFNLRQQLPSLGFKINLHKPVQILPCAITRSQRRYNKVLARVEATITRQLDLVNFLRQQKMLLLSFLSMLSAPQQKYIRQLAQVNFDQGDSYFDSGTEMWISKAKMRTCMAIKTQTGGSSTSKSYGKKKTKNRKLCQSIIHYQHRPLYKPSKLTLRALTITSSFSASPFPQKYPKVILDCQDKLNKLISQTVRCRISYENKFKSN